MRTTCMALALLTAVSHVALTHNQTASAEEPKFRAIAFYSTTVEKAHVDFAKDALEFYAKLAKEQNFVFDSTTDWSNHNHNYLAKYDVVMWLNQSTWSKDQRAAFEEYMKNGGAWLGFHVSGYNDKDSHWPWFVEFLGGAVFNNNNWPVGPPATKMHVDTTDHPATKRLPESYDAPPNEWYQWVPSPRLSKDVTVLITIDPSAFPIGKKDVLTGGDVPIAWTNKNYKMIYTCMGHGDSSGVFSSEIQNKFLEDALLWLGEKKPK
jgi:hypothetical protein